MSIQNPQYVWEGQSESLIKFLREDGHRFNPNICLLSLESRIFSCKKHQLSLVRNRKYAIRLKVDKHAELHEYEHELWKKQQSNFLGDHSWSLSEFWTNYAVDDKLINQLG
jgi:hypothetical protein